MIAFAPWQYLLDAIGWLIVQIYALVPNYGVTIILLTVLIRLVLLPLGIKQIRSMQHMQIVQPKVKQIQQKYKQNKQKQQEEIMKLYKEYGVNPFSGCWPVLLQFPILIAMYSVLRWPQHPVHVPADSTLYTEAIEPQIPEPPTPEALAELPGPPGGTSFLGMNLLCSATNAGKDDATLADSRTSADGEKVLYPVDCGTHPIDRVPYYVFAVLMFATTYYQQRQMQKASPPGAASQQQQALLKVMPIMFGVFGIFFPAGLVVYWTTSNAWQIGQQYFMLKSRPTEETLVAKASGNGKDKPAKKGFMASMMERAEGQKKGRTTGKPGTEQRKPGGKQRKPGPTGGAKGSGGATGGTGKPASRPKPGQRPKKPGSGGSGGGDPDNGSER